MDFTKYKNAVVIVKDKSKKEIVKMINSLDKLLNIKIITLSELKKKYFFDYTKETVFYVSKKYNVISEIAEIYIDNLYYVKDIDDEKVKFLNEVKKNLLSCGLLQINRQFKNFLTNKTIILYNLENVDKFYESIFEELKLKNDIIEYNDVRESSKKKLYKAQNKDEEIAFVASCIASLIKSGVDINHIKIANVQSDYLFTIKNTFKQFKIPVELDDSSSLNGTIIIDKFKELYSSDIVSIIEELKTYANGEEEQELLECIISVLNDYSWCNNYQDVKDMIIKDLDRIKLSGKSYKNAVRVIDFKDDIISDDDYVFLINFNQGSIPSTAKDEDYLNDKIKAQLGISTSVDLNVKRVCEVQKRIGETNHLIVTYSAHDLTNELYISNAFDENLFEIKEIEIGYNSSNDYNKLKLLSAKDEYKKFGTVRDDLVKLENHYKGEEYCSYKNDYSGVDAGKLYTFMDNKLTLSYTSMDLYYKCAFRYYLEYVLKLDKYENNFQAIIGSIFHSILSKCFEDNFDFESAWLECTQVEDYEFNNMEKFFLNNLKGELILVIDTIKNQMDYCSLKKRLYEKEIIVPIDDKLNIRFKGFIDKVLYDDFDGETIVAVIDYKTGNPDLSIENSVYGLDMQLPIYIYLLKKASKTNNLRIGGFYLQKILNNISDSSKRVDSLKLQGYSNSDLSVLEKVDNSYMNSQVIRSLKMTSNGFSAYSKVLSDESMDVLSNIVDSKIKEASKEIINANFAINPKELNGKLEGCSFCKFKDICYMKNADIVKLKKVSKEDMLGGEVNA